ncbi:MAG TPA: CARDB domain-containing protein [Solirubrobacteraceae bacterium]|nr:CARDB domain-containing protein [Solirubrobacteraceae bacterium]
MALVIVIVLLVIGVHSCSVSQANSALRNYNDSVASLIRASNQNGDQMFSALSGGVNTSNVTTVAQQVDTARLTASNQLTKAENLGAPGAVGTAQQNLVQLMRMRRDAMANIAADLPQTLQSSTAGPAVNSIAAEMERLYGSDVLYKDYVLPNIVKALKQAGIAVGGADGEPIDANQLVPNVQWVLPSFVASQLKVSVPASSGGKPAPGLHGHALDSCSVGSNTLSTSSATTLPTGSAPTLTCQVTNGGTNTETNVIVSASVSGTSITGQGTIPQTQAGQQYNVQITLSKAPPAGTYDLVVDVHAVPGETNLSNNKQTYPVTFG